MCVSPQEASHSSSLAVVLPGGNAYPETHPRTLFANLADSVHYHYPERNSKCAGPESAPATNAANFRGQRCFKNAGPNPAKIRALSENAESPAPNEESTSVGGCRLRTRPTPRAFLNTKALASKQGPEDQNGMIG